MCLQNEKECYISKLIGYAVVIKEEDESGELYRGVYRNYFVAKQGVRMEAVMFGDSIGGFYAFKELDAAVKEKNTWKNEDVHVIVECILEGVFAEGIFSLFPVGKSIPKKGKKKKKRTPEPLAVRAKYRTVIREIDPKIATLAGALWVLELIFGKGLNQ